MPSSSASLAFEARQEWYRLNGLDLNVVVGSVTIDPDTNVLRCAKDGLKLIYDVAHNIHKCPSCSTAAIGQVAEMVF